MDLRQRISDALLKAAFSDWDVGEGTVIELPLTVAADAVMKVLDPPASTEPRTATHGGEVIDPRRNYR